MHLSRRTALRTLAAGAGGLLLPAHRPALAQRSPSGRETRARFLFVLQSNGFHPWAAQPKGLERTEQGPDRAIVESLRGFELSEDLGPLEPFKHRTAIIQRLSGVHAWPHHSAQFAALSGAAVPWRNRFRAKQTAMGETIDAALARALPAPVPIVNLGVENHEDGLKENGRDRAAICSAWSRERPIETCFNPALAYGDLFGPESPGADAGLFDFIEDAEVRGRVRPNLDDRYWSEVEADRLEAQFDLATAALVGGLTNVATIVSGACNTNGRFDGLGFDEFDQHAVGHFRPVDRWREIYTKLRRYHLGLVADVVRKLEAIPEGDGTMMDNTVIVYTSDGAETHHSRGIEWPFVIIGGLQNRLRTDCVIEYPAHGRPGNRTINALYCTLLNAAGVAGDEFNLAGEGDGERVDSPGPLEELLV